MVLPGGGVSGGGIDGAAGGLTEDHGTNVGTGDLLDDIINQGNDFGGTSLGFGNTIKSFITNNVRNAVWTIGNLIFAAITVILGAKYIWSGAEGKSEALESLPAFVIAVIFFYLGGNLVDFLMGATTGFGNAPAWINEEGTGVANKIMWLINTFVRYASFAGILVLGIKYMFASAEGKSRLKTNFGGVILGIIFVFLASNVVNFIIDIGENIL